MQQHSIIDTFVKSDTEPMFRVIKALGSCEYYRIYFFVSMTIISDQLSSNVNPKFFE